MVKVELKILAQKHVAAFIMHTSFVENRQAQEIPPFFHKILQERTLDSVPDRTDMNHICVFDKKQYSPEFDYYMGVEVSTLENIPEDMGSITIPAGKFAAASFIKRGNPDVMKVIGYITEQWIPENSLVQNFNVPPFIYYDDRFLTVYNEKGYEGNPVAEIFIPVN